MQITHAQIRYALSIAAALLCISPLQGRAQTPSEIVKNYRRLQHDVTLLQRKHLVRSKSKDAKELQQEVHAVRQQFVDQNRPKAKTNRDKLCIVQVLRRLRQYGQAAILLGEISKTLNLGGAHEEVRYQEIEALYHKRQYEAVVPMVEQHLQQYPRGKHRQRLSNIWRKIKQGWKEGRLQGSIPASLNLEHQIGTTVDFRLDDHRGEVVLLFFFGSYGKSSLQKLPVLSTLQSK